MTQEQRNLIEQEDRLRSMFAEDRDNPQLNDLHLGLVDIYSNYGRMIYQDLSDDEVKKKNSTKTNYRFEIDKKIQKLIPRVLIKHQNPNLKAGFASIVTESEFRDNWQRFTQGLFQGLNWNNVFAAGGAVLACILKDPQAQQSFQNSDIDLFICEFRLVDLKLTNVFLKMDCRAKMQMRR